MTRTLLASSLIALLILGGCGDDDEPEGDVDAGQDADRADSRRDGRDDRSDEDGDVLEDAAEDRAGDVTLVDGEPEDAGEDATTGRLYPGPCSTTTTYTGGDVDTREYSYDAEQRLAGVHLTDSSGFETDEESYVYSVTGALLEYIEGPRAAGCDDPSATYTYLYDEGGVRVGMQADSRDDVACGSVADNIADFVFEYSYDMDGALTGMTRTVSGSMLEHRARFTRDMEGSYTGIEYDVRNGAAYDVVARQTYTVTGEFGVGPVLGRKGTVGLEPGPTATGTYRIVEEGDPLCDPSDGACPAPSGVGEIAVEVTVVEGRTTRLTGDRPIGGELESDDVTEYDAYGNPRRRTVTTIIPGSSRVVTYDYSCWE